MFFRVDTRIKFWKNFRKPLCAISLRGNCFAHEYLHRDWFSRAGPQGSNALLRVHRVREREVATGGGGVS